MKKCFSNLLVFASVALILVSCSNGPDERTPGEYLSAYIKANSDVVAFGKIDINTILEKAEYRSVPKFGLVVNGYLQSLAGSINLETPVHFALEGPLLEDGTPKTLIAFVETINADSLAAKLMQQGYDLEESGGMRYFSSGDVAVGLKNNLSLVVSKREKYNAREVLSKAFSDVRKELSGDKVEDILEENGDITAGVSFENLYLTSNTELSKLSDKKKNELKEMVHDSYLKTAVSFEDGQMVMHTENLFSEALMSKMFFRTDSDAKILEKLGKGEPIMGFSMNIDMNKIQHFFDTYSPNSVGRLFESVGETSTSIMMGDRKLSNWFNGELGIVMLGQPDMMGGLSDFNFFVGLGKKGKAFIEQPIIMGMLKESMEHVKLEGSELIVASKKTNTGGEITLPNGSDGFGMKGMYYFLNLEKADLSSFEFEGPSKLLNQLKYISFEMDNENSTLVVKSKKDNVNILKEVTDVLMKELKGKISGLDS